MFKYSEKTLIYHDIPEMSLEKYIYEEFKSGEPDWELIAVLINDDDHVRDMIEYYNESQEEATKTYKEIYEESLMDLAADIKSKFSKIGQLDINETQYGDVPDNIDPNSSNLDYSELSSFFGANTADGAVNLVKRFAPNKLEGIVYIGITWDTSVAGVFESDLTQKILEKSETEIYTNKAIAFRISPNKINSEVEGLLQEINPNSINALQASDIEQIQQLVIAEVIVHEATHAEGATDEATPIAEEKAFLQLAISEINNEREAQNLPPLPITIKS